MQDEMMDLMDVSNEIQETLGRSYNVPDDIDEEELMGGMALISVVRCSQIIQKLTWSTSFPYSGYQLYTSISVLGLRFYLKRFLGTLVVIPVLVLRRPLVCLQTRLFSICCSHFECWKMQSLMLWKLIWTLNQIQSHRTSSQTRRQILILSLTYLLHQVVMQQSRQTGSR